MTGGSYELGSVFKTLTLRWPSTKAWRNLDTMLDVRQPLEAGRFTVTDFHPAGRPLSVTEVFTHSSNVGAGMLALQAGPETLQRLLAQARNARSD